MFIIAANWKMNGNVNFAQTYCAELDKFINEQGVKSEIIVLPSAPLLTVVKGNFKIGGQNCHYEKSGAFTGEISAELLKNLGCDYALCGHSERRQMGESSELIAAKAEASHNAGLKAIICIGENDGEDFAKTVFAQLDKSLPFTATAANTIIAYEPVWAIGTGRTPSTKDIEERHAEIKTKSGFKVIYGGSVKPENAAEISNAANVDGLLVGGASLDIEQFKKIITARK